MKTIILPFLVFTDNVEELSREERDEMAKAPFSLENYEKALDITLFMVKKDIQPTNVILFVLP